MNSRRHAGWVSTAAALLAGLLLRLWFIAHTATVSGDTLIYGEIAKNWMLRGIYGFAIKHGTLQPTLIRLPGYPLFLSGCFRLFGPDSYPAVMCVQALVDLGTCLLCAALAERLFGPRARAITLWISALCPFTANYTAAPLTEILTLFCIALTFYAFERWTSAGAGFNRWLWLVAAALSYSILLRPEQGLLAAAVVPAMLWTVIERDRARWQRASIPVVAAFFSVLLPFIPWTIRNERTFHLFQPLAPRYATDPGELVPRGFQRWYRSWAIDFATTETVYWNYDDAPILIEDLPTRAFDSDDQYSRTEAILNSYNLKMNATVALDARFAAIARERIAASPMRYYVVLPAARLANMILRPRVEMFAIPLEWWRWSQHPAATAFAAAYALLNAAYLLLAAMGTVLWRHRAWLRRKPLACAMLASIVLRCLLLLTLDNSEPRYTLEFFPVLFVLAAALVLRSNDSLPRSSSSA